MKLYVVGSNSPNPKDWGQIDYALILAGNENEAQEIAALEFKSPVCEIPMDEAQLLIRLLT